MCLFGHMHPFLQKPLSQCLQAGAQPLQVCDFFTLPSVRLEGCVVCICEEDGDFLVPSLVNCLSFSFFVSLSLAARLLEEKELLLGLAS